MALLAREIGIGPLSGSPSFGRRVRACLLVAWVAGLTWIWPRSAWAGRISVWLEVGRAPESRQCPDAATVLATAKALFPGIALDSVTRPEQASLVAVISIGRGPEGQVALLTLRGAHAGQRRIVDRDDNCRGLSHALAVALLLLIEPTATPLEPSPPGRPSANPARRPLSPARRFRGGMALQTGGLGSVGLLGRPAWGGLLGLELWHESGLAIRVRGLRLFADPTHYPRGTAEVTVDVNLWALMLGPCWHLAPAGRWSVTSCLDVGWGTQHGQAEGGYSGLGGVDRPWLVVGPSFTLGVRFYGPLEGILTGGTAGTLLEQTYTINNDEVQRQAGYGGYLGLGLGLRWSDPDRLGSR
jgi:hypothetical protein